MIILRVGVFWCLGVFNNTANICGHCALLLVVQVRRQLKDHLDAEKCELPLPDNDWKEWDNRLAALLSSHLYEPETENEE